MRHDPAAVLLYCLVNQQELDLIAGADWLALPPGPPEQTEVTLVFCEADATPLTRPYSAPAADAGYVVRLAVEADYAAQFPVRWAGLPGQESEALDVPAEELAGFNQHILGQIEVVSLFNP